METWLKTTKQFEDWRKKLGETTNVRLDTRLRQALDAGHFGDHHGVGGGKVSEMRLMFGAGWRVYYTTWEYKGHVVLMLLGGDKDEQQKNIRTAKAMVAEARKKAEREIDEELERREKEKQHGKR